MNPNLCQPCTPVEHHEKGSFLFHLALHIFYFSTGIIVFVSLGLQLYACIKQGRLKILVATMALYKLPNAEAFNGTLPMSAPIVPNEGHAKYVCLNPWIDTLVTLASLVTIVAFLMVKCRKCTLCRGLEYATACHIYVFISRNNRYSIKLLHYRFIVQFYDKPETAHGSPRIAQGMPMGQHAHKLGRSDPYQWGHQNKAPLQCANTHERKIKIVQPYERPRLHSPSCSSPGTHMVHS